MENKEKEDWSGTGQWGVFRGMNGEKTDKVISCTICPCICLAWISYDEVFLSFVSVYVGHRMSRVLWFMSLCMWVSWVDMYELKKRRERRCVVRFCLAGWWEHGRSSSSYIMTESFYSHLSHTLWPSLLYFQLAVFCFAQKVSLHFLRISIFFFLSFFVIVCWTSHRFLCSAVVGIHSWIGMTAKSITHMLVSCINIYLRLSSHKCSGKTGLPCINISWNHSAVKYTFKFFKMFCIPFFFFN